MKTGKDLRWLDRKTRFLNTSSPCSLLEYVSSSRSIGKSNASESIKLDANENLFVDSRNLNIMLHDVVKNLDLRLYDFEVIGELKEALGKYVGVPPKCVAVGSGSEQFIDLIVNLLLEKGDNVVSILPSFFMYQKRVLLKEAKFFGVPLKTDLSLDIEAILNKVTSKTKLLFICSPNNPTGNQFEWNKMEALVDECSAIVVIDEAYAEFADYSVASLAFKKRNVVVLRTFSKAFGLAGMRFGYATAHPSTTSLLSGAIPHTLSTVTTRYVLRLLSNMCFVQRSIEIAKKERNRLIDELRDIKDVDVFDSKANFVTFRPHKDAGLVHRKLLENGITIKNLGNQPVIGHCLRMTVGLEHMNNQVLGVLKQVLGEIN